MRSALFALFSLGCQEYGLQNGNHAPPPAEETSTVPADESGEPVADAGADQEAKPLDTITLDGTASYDPSGLDIVAMKWTLVSKPSGSTAELSDPAVPKPEVFVDLAGDYVFELTVKNEDGVWDSTPDKVKVNATPADGFYVELSWDAGNDLDLHLLHGSDTLFTQGDCNYCNKHPNWNDSVRTDDPSLDWDVIQGFGPETITIDDPSADTYQVGVHYYGENGLASCVGACAQATATVSIYISGSLAATYHHQFSDQGDLWQVARIEWPSAKITEVDSFTHTNLTTCN
jgi:hypothetical protein